MDELRDAVARSIEGRAEVQLERSVFGTDAPDAVASQLSEACRERMGTEPEDVLFYTSSVGCTVGLRLADGSEAVLKAYPLRWTEPFLAAVDRVQAHLAASGFPCPEPLAEPRPLARGHIRFESVLPDPGPQDDRSPVARRTFARALAEQVRICAHLNGAEALAEAPLRTPSGHLYPEPHSPLFDFEASAWGAEWIDGFAAQAKGLRDTDDTPPVVAHTDWSARNVRIAGDRLLAAYDWDSLALVPESVAIGQAAMSWSLSFEEGTADTVPEPGEVAAFLREYEEARGAPLGAGRRRAAYGAALWLLAYVARCEHALEVTGVASAGKVARSHLRTHGEALLALARS